MRKFFLVSLVAFIGFFILAQTSFAATVAYEWLPGQNSNSMSRHGTFGPVLADDFSPVLSGNVVQVDWWGNLAQSTGWELTFHNDAPAGTPSWPFISQQMLSASGVGPDANGIFLYSTAWIPQDVYITAGTTYWFSAANFISGWYWATPGSLNPTVGSETYDAKVSVGGSGGVVSGPHDGPWANAFPADADLPNFAFRIWVDDGAVVPIPGAIWLLGSGLIGLAGIRKKYKS